jgi:hypothetical protein
MEKTTGRIEENKIAHLRRMKRRYARIDGFNEKIEELNRLIDKGGDIARDAKEAKARLIQASLTPAKKPGKTKKKAKGKRAKVDLLDTRVRLPGSFESGKRR